MSYQSAQDPEENLPEWLKALRKRQNQERMDSGEEPAAQEVPAAANEPSGKQEPDWLQEIRSRYKRDKPESAETPTEETKLADTQPRRVEKIEEASPPPEESVLPVAIPAEAQADPQSPAEMDGESTGPAYAPPFPEGEVAISAGELPSWLEALRPGSNFPKEDARSEEILPGSTEGGLLAGLGDVLPADPHISKMEKPPVFSARLEVSENQSLHAAAFTKLIETAEVPPEDETRRVARPTRMLNIGMAAALILAVLIPLLTQSRAAIRPDSSLFPEVSSAFGKIDVITAGAPVLVAFEVQPALYGEMEPLLSAIVGHLLDRQAHLVFISTQPTGPGLAERLLHDQFSTNPSVATGSYIQLGYLSGGVAALRSFVSDPRSAILSTANGAPDPWQNSALQPIQQLSQFAAVIVVSSSAEDGRAWIEQSSGSLPGGLLAVTSAQAAPLLRAYLHTDPLTLQGLVSGVHGAALYERLGSQDNLGSSYWDAYSYGLGALVLLILLGGLYSRVIYLKPEKPKQTESTRGA